LPTYTLAELSELLGEPFEGNGSLVLTGVGEITAAKEGTLSFVANPKYVAKIAESQASALIVPLDLETDFLPLIRSANPYLTFTKALSLFHQNSRKTSGGVHPASKVSASAQLGRDVTIMPHAIVEEGAVIGDNSILYPGVYIGNNALIGTNVTLYPHVSIGEGCELGANVILHGGCRIGITSHPYLIGGPTPVTLEEDVELGANVVVSGSQESPTVLGRGTKVDNLVQVGLGVQVGQHCIVVAQVTIGDHVHLGDHSVVAGQVVISPNLTVGARSRIGAKSVVQTDVPPDSDFWGDPAQPINKEKRLKANLARLPRLFEKIQLMEDALKAKKNS
jgi:UDP-3-O-[3-hydroxymyristoyl] glucosamine N-acyltransferase